MNQKQIDILKQNLTIKDGQPVTSSLKVAESFEREHRTVLQAIRDMECSPEFRLQNFLQMAHFRANPVTGGQTESPYFAITQNGFLFLAMGFSGKKAAMLREGYILAFEQMAAALQQQPTTTLNHQADALLSMVAEAGGRGYAPDFLPTLVQCRRAGLSCEQTGRVLRVSASAVSNWHRKLIEAGVQMPSGTNRPAAAVYFKRMAGGQAAADKVQLPLFPLAPGATQ